MTAEGEFGGECSLWRLMVLRAGLGLGIFVVLVPVDLAVTAQVRNN